MSNTPLTHKDLDEAYRQMTDYKRIGEREKFNHEHQFDWVADALKRIECRRRLQDILCAIVFVTYWSAVRVVLFWAALALRVKQCLRAERKGEM